MTEKPHSKPSMEHWEAVADSFKQRVQRQGPSTELDKSLQQKHMLAQAICHEVPAGTRYRWRTADSLLQTLQNETHDLFHSLEVKFKPTSFGLPSSNQFDEISYFSWWCLVMEFATCSSPGSTIEFVLGNLSGGIELEIGGDCKSLECKPIADSNAFQFASLLGHDCETTSLKCPLGGAAIQINLPATLPASVHRAA